MCTVRAEPCSQGMVQQLPCLPYWYTNFHDIMHAACVQAMKRGQQMQGNANHNLYLSQSCEHEEVMRLLLVVLRHDRQVLPGRSTSM